MSLQYALMLVLLLLAARHPAFLRLLSWPIISLNIFVVLSNIPEVMFKFVPGVYLLAVCTNIKVLHDLFVDDVDSLPLAPQFIFVGGPFVIPNIVHWGYFISVIDAKEVLFKMNLLVN